jgi:hypothetical protein
MGYLFPLLSVETQQLQITHLHYMRKWALLRYIYILFGLWGYWHCGHSWPIVPASGDSEDGCGEADEM